MRRLATATLGLAMAVVVAGCGAGQVTQTSSQQSGVNGVSVNLGDIAIRNAEVAYPETPEHAYRSGADMPVAMTIVNQGNSDDQLVSISSPIAREVPVEGVTKLPAGTALRAEFPESSAGESSAGESSAAQPSSSAAEPSGSGQPSGSSAESSSAAAPGDEQDIGLVTITVTGLTRQFLRPGQVVPVTITFAKAGSVQLEIPVANPPEGAPEPGSESEH